MRLVIRHGRLIDPASNHDAVADLYIADGRIVALGSPPAGFAAEREIDARGLVVAPGLVDLCARMREPGAEGALKREMRAALAGGVTAWSARRTPTRRSTNRGWCACCASARARRPARACTRSAR